MLSRWTSFCCLLIVGSAVGCAHTRTDQRLRELTTRVADLDRLVVKQRRTIEDLGNRLFLLRDRVDANRVAVGRKRPAARPSRPVPRPAARAAPAPRPVAARRAGRSRESAADAASRRARRRLPVVKLRRGRRAHRRAHRKRRARSRKKKRSKRIVLRLTGTPPARGGRRPPLGPAPTVRDRLAVVPLPGAGTAPATTGPIQAYKAARALLKARKLAAAAKAFSVFGKRYPRHPYADNAYYWLAECFYLRNQVRKAAWVLRKLLKKYPSGNKAPSALLKLALCEARMGRKAKARKVLAQVMQLYPRTQEAARAAKQLRRLR